MRHPLLTLSTQQARKAVLLSQGINQQPKLGKGLDATRKAIEQLGYVQIDTISVVERAHHHTLWNRTQDYQPEHLDTLQQSGQIFEYWSHAAAYLPIRDFRFSLPRKHAIKSGAERHWREREPKLMSRVLQRIEAEGPLSSKDFGEPKRQNNEATGWWDWKPTKAALEQLFMEGDLMVCKREGFRKIYDLSERVISDDVDTQMPSEAEFLQYLIKCYLKANSLGTAAQISYLRKGLRSKIETRCQEMLETGELTEVLVIKKHSENQHYYARSDLKDLISKPLSQRAVNILSPFDNLLIQRKRMLDLFDFDYQIECYVPKAKRQYGYFCLPLLWGQQFAGRMDAKIDRKSGILHILNLHLETQEKDQFMQALSDPLDRFSAFNKGHQIEFS